MAEKLSKSILRNLDHLRKMLHRAPKKSSASASKKPSTSKGSARDHKASRVSVDRAPAQEGAAEAPDAKPDQKKTPNQPWYRHRQRW
jgi:hypothetical protein